MMYSLTNLLSDVTMMSWSWFVSVMKIESRYLLDFEDIF